MADARMKDSLLMILIALALVAASFVLQGHIGINLADEGYLLYGSLRTGMGEIPMRDFNSYDPGRYYWTALGMKIMGDGIIPFRISVAIFQFLGLACGLLALRRVFTSRILLIVAGFVLLVWMFPRHKLFEHSIAMASVYIAVLLFERPTLSRHFISGLFVGLVAFFGRNHGLYSFVSHLSLIFFIWFKLSREDLPKRMAIWFSGIAVGYLPMVLMLLLVPGFARSFSESITFLLNLGATNLTLPVPWPWRINFSGGSILTVIQQAIVGTLFLVMPFYFIAATIYSLLTDGRTLNQRALFVVSCFIGLMYMHYAFSRADIAHLAQGIHPFLLGIMAFPLTGQKHHKSFRVAVLLVMLLLSLFSIGLASPYYKWASQEPRNFETLDIRGNRILVDAGTAKLIKTVRRINDELVKPDEQLLIAPNWPMFYAIMNRKAPLWETYFLHRRSQGLQAEMINQLKIQKTNWAIIADIPFDGRDDLRFSSTHRLLWDYLNVEFRPIDVKGLPTNYRLLRRTCNSQ